MKRSVALACLLVAVGFIAACGDETGRADTVAVATTSDSSPDTDPDASAAGPDGAGADTDQDSTTTDPTSSSDDASGGSATTADLPGTFFDIGPQAGERLDVISVRHDDVLNFRTRPEASAPLVDSAAPQAASPVVLSSGEGRLFDNSAWWKVTVGGQEAWANFAYLGMLGRSDDILDELKAGSALSEGETVEAIVTSIAASRADGPKPRVTYVAPITGVGASDRLATVDVVGLGDDALKGERFEFRFEPIGEGFRLTSADRTLICGRGVTSGGLCV